MENLEKKLSRNKNTILFFAFIVSITIYLDSKFLFLKNIIWPFIVSHLTMSDFILFFTFLALVWYTRETQKIREIEEKPIVDLYYRPETTKHEKYFRLRNNGKGVAYNIQVEAVESDDKIFEFYFKDPNLILTSGDEQTFLVDAKHEYNQSKELKSDPLSRFLDHIIDKSISNADENNLNLLYDKQKTKIIITYENALNKKFKRIFYIYYKTITPNLTKEYEIKFDKEEIL